ncbi:MAG TPA: TlpA disulfide reductase family protein [Chitinophagaceae bacterium]|nr:TlpA disulfide reductase family protein [Chitinophagaceae bacterium]
MQTEKKKNIRQWIRGNWLNIALLLFLSILIFNPDAKALLIKGFMKMGFMKPGIPAANSHNTVALAPDAVFVNAAGQPLHLSEQRGKVVFLNFWATWCPPCIAEMGPVNNLYEHFKNDSNVVFILADADNNFSKSLPFMNHHQYNLPVFAAPSAGDDLFNGTLPATTVINKKGQIVFHEEGAANYDTREFIDFINKLIAE